MPLSLLTQQPAALALPAPLAFRLPLVMQFLAAGERDLDLGAALVVEIELQRDDRHAFAFNRTCKLVDLALVQQELAWPLGRVIEAARLQVLGNIGIDQP